MGKPEKEDRSMLKTALLLLRTLRVFQKKARARRPEGEGGGDVVARQEVLDLLRIVKN